MKKNGKKWRQMQKEKEEKRKNIKVGEPFSSAKLKKRLCFHYAGRPGGFIAGYCWSKLVIISESECMCVDCRKVFPIERYEQMERLVKYLSNKGCCTDVQIIYELSKGIEPVYYRRLSEDEVEIIGYVNEVN